MRLANEIAAAAMEHTREHLRPGMKESEAAAIWEGFVHGEGTGFEGPGRARARLLARLVGPRDPHLHRDRPPARSRSTSRRCSRSGSAPTATGATTRRTSAPASCVAEYAAARASAARRLRPRARPLPARRLVSELDRLIRDGIAEAGYPGQPSHPICHGVGARAHEPPYAHQAGGGTIEEGMVLAIEPGIYWEGGGGLRLEDNYLITATGAEKLCRSRTTSVSDDLDRRTQRPVPPRRLGRPLRHDAPRRRADRRRRARPGAEARDRACSSTSSGSTGSRPASRASRTTTGDAVRADLRRRPARGGLGLLARGSRRPRGARRARRARVRDRVADLRSQARRDRRHPREDARPDHRRDALRRRARDPRRVLRRRLDPRRPRLLRAGLPRRGRGRAQGGRRRRHARDRLARGRRRARRPDRRVGRRRACPSTSTATTTSASRRRRAVAAVRAGATWVQGTINGMGERAGNANLGEVALALRALYGVESNLRLDRIRAVSERVRELSGYELAAVEARHRRERSSAARAARSRASSTTRRRSSRTRRSSSRAERAIVLGKKSGLDSIRIKAEELGLDVPEERRAELLAAVKALGAEKHGLVTDDEFRDLVAEELSVPTTQSSSAAGSTRSRRARCSRAAAGASACSSANDYLGGAIKHRRARRSPATSTTCSARGTRSGSAAPRTPSSATSSRHAGSST